MSKALERQILVVDDEEGIRRVLSRFLERRGWRVCLATDEAEALGILGRESPMLLLTDLRMATGARAGAELVARARALRPELKVIVMSGYNDLTDAELSSLGASTLLRKPFDLNVLVSTIEDVCASNRALVDTAARFE